jgi:hypothetical protein
LFSFLSFSFYFSFLFNKFFQLLLLLCAYDLHNTKPCTTHVNKQKQNKHTLWPESASELYRPNDSRLSAKLVPTFANRECHVVRVTDPYGRILEINAYMNKYAYKY